MVAAKIAVLNTGTKRAAAKATGISAEYVGHAAVVLEYAPHLADAVVAARIANLKAKFCVGARFAGQMFIRLNLSGSAATPGQKTSFFEGFLVQFSGSSSSALRKRAPKNLRSERLRVE